MSSSQQITIVHLSDLHFGESHRFDPPVLPAGDRGSTAGHPSLLETLQADWKKQNVGNSVVVAVTGDLTYKASPDEYKCSRLLLDGIVSDKVLGKTITKQEVFVIPGNHDVAFDQSDLELRSQPFCNFYSQFYGGLPGREIDCAHPETLSRVHDRSKDLGLIIVELNSCLYVEKGNVNQNRGQVDNDAIGAVRDQLKAIPIDDLRRSIRVALIHHHPVLIPAFEESGRGYDSIANSAPLLKVLRDYGFHLLLHGHKHYPHTFVYDVSCSWLSSEAGPMLILAGGSAGSTDLPVEPNAVNTYNLITITWNGDSKEARVRVQTRGLSMFDPHGAKLLPKDRTWFNLRQVDKLLRFNRTEKSPVIDYVEFDEDTADAEAQRMQVYKDLRLNMPVVEVVPSLNSGQEYDAKVWIAPHKGRTDIPVEVTWSAGPKFYMARCSIADNPSFLAYFSFWGPMMIQARIRFEDGTIAYANVYAHMPSDQAPPEETPLVS